MFFDGWQDLVRGLVIGVTAYVGLVFLLRISGKRTLSKLNAFDLVITVALGSTLATCLLSKDVSLSEGLLAFAILIGLQWAVTWLSVRSSRWTDLVKSEPRLLLRSGRFLPEALREERITEQEIHAAIRAQNLASSDDLAAVVLETDGTLSIIPNLGGSDGDRSIRPVRGYESETRVPAA